MINTKAATSVSEEVIRQVATFHGHMCPGVAIGIRAAEYALQKVGPTSPSDEIVAIVETDMCAVDAIQVMLGCTFGRGNFVYLDYGKNAFTFYRRSDGKAVRVAAKPGAFGPPSQERLAGFRKMREGTMTAEESKRFWGIQKEKSEWVLAQPLETIFNVTAPHEAVPRRARMHNSIVCEKCGVPTMETRIHTFEGKHYCIPCFEEVGLRHWPFAKGKAGC
jgi:formylmethanofuran dehydrogenase subunit E